jgi:SOS-response transcriptional repressor LexA
MSAPSLFNLSVISSYPLQIGYIFRRIEVPSAASIAIMIIIAGRNDAKEGDIVIAEVDGGWTMKYFKKKNGKPYLLPANKDYKPIYPKYDLKVAAVVKGVIRKY